MSRTIAGLLAGLVRGGSAWMKPYRRTITRALVAEQVTPTITVATPAGPLAFYSPSARALHDPWHLAQGEPETIRWLDGLGANEVLWDIGANVGLYALYAARARGMRVLAFEPSASSYAVLVRNVELNRLDPLIDPYCLAFDQTTRLDHLHMAHTEAGHSMHAFGQSHTIEGEIATVFRQAVAGFSVDDFCRLFQPPPPDHIKLDVDSIEVKILRGAEHTLRTAVRSVLVEVDDLITGDNGREIRAFLTSIGFTEVKDFAPDPTARNTLFRRSI
ncbi:MAG: FkbM family methyltransferase [Azospirillum sp.]|nr:FkbM family methyltransferase [Azospirillum sp.]